MAYPERGDETRKTTGAGASGRGARFAQLRLTACTDCDLVQREPACPASCVVRCRRCGAVLHRQVLHAADGALALTLAAAIFFLIANVLPIMSLELQGRQTTATLLGLVLALDRANMPGVGILVFVTLILMPALEILARLHLLLPLRFGRRPWRMGLVARVLPSMRAWSMVEVFVLAALVSMHRLDQIARLELGPALWALCAVMVLFAVTYSIFDARDVWSRPAGSTA